MRTLQIGDRKLSDMKPEEFVDFVYDFGYCGSPEFWNKPIITQFEFDKITSDDAGSIFFKFYQLRKEDGKKIEMDGHITFGSADTKLGDRMGIYIVNGNTKHASHNIFQNKVINHFLNLGFDLPFYNKA